jgi:hypothetical protein
MYPEVSTIQPVQAIPPAAIFGGWPPPTPPQETCCTVRCDICGVTAKGPRENHYTEGWFLGRRENFCPTCNTPE